MSRKQFPAKKQPRNRRTDKGRGVRGHAGIEDQFDISPTALPKADRSPIEPRTDAQRRYLNAIQHFKLVFAVGPAGVGKTWIIGAKAAQALDEKKIDKIVITRPGVEAGEKWGALPGEMEDKFGPYLAPFRDVLDERLGRSYVDFLMKTGKIEAAPLAFMRGRTFKNAVVVLDEAQNTTPMQMKLFLTRIGEGCTVIVNGDISQKDIPGESGLTDAVKRLSHIPSVKVVNFTSRDIVRSGLVQEIVEAYDAPSPDEPRLH